MFVTTFQAANTTYMRQAKVEYPSNVEELTLEQESTKRHVLQLCGHYERLVSVLTAYLLDAGISPDKVNQLLLL
ncbi:unnamed protein product [Peronospora destructor]|uniref:Mitotic-spindle organizing protein 1 n=1 Tax=Peronospora destructor TaxID=86335 RepID=A0AAV0UC33_9STRA|nr:unnamed protein product [Peronospora destructor]